MARTPFKKVQPCSPPYQVRGRLCPIQLYPYSIPSQLFFDTGPG